MVRTMWLLVLLVPSTAALGIDVGVEPGISVDVELPDQQGSGHVQVCAVVTCVGQAGSEASTAYAASTQGHASSSYRQQSTASEHEDITPWAVAVPAAGLLALLAKFWWFGPGRVVALFAGPGRLLGLGLATKWAWPTGLENETRQAMKAFIEENPGASIQETRQHVSVAWGTAVYHLQRLERSGELVSVRSGNHHRYWIAGSQEAGVRHAWAVLEQPMTQAIAEAVQEEPGIHQTGLCERLKLNTPTASKHLKRLVSYGLVQTKRCNRFVMYAPTERLDQVLALRSAKAAA